MSVRHDGGGRRCPRRVQAGRFRRFPAHAGAVASPGRSRLPGLLQPLGHRRRVGGSLVLRRGVDEAAVHGGRNDDLAAVRRRRAGGGVGVVGRPATAAGGGDEPDDDDVGCDPQEDGRQEEVGGGWRRDVVGAGCLRRGREDGHDGHDGSNRRGLEVEEGHPAHHGRRKWIGVVVQVGVVVCG